jgi:hypothetical protein
MKTTLTAQLAGLEQVAELTSLDAKRLEMRLFERVEDMKALLGRHIPQTRQLLRRLIQDDIVNGKRRQGRIVCTPFENASGRGYEMRAKGTYVRLLRAGLVVKDGGGGHGSRTRDPDVANVVLSQLS